MIVFFCDFPKFFPVEIFHTVSTLRIQNFMIIGQGVPGIFEWTDKLFCNIDSNLDWRLIEYWIQTNFKFQSVQIFRDFVTVN